MNTFEITSITPMIKTLEPSFGVFIVNISMLDEELNASNNITIKMRLSYSESLSLEQLKDIAHKKAIAVLEAAYVHVSSRSLEQLDLDLMEANKISD